MSFATVIGRGTRIRGRVTGAVDLEVEGQLEGEVAIDGDLEIASTALVSAGLSARRIVVRGAVRGNLNGEEVVLLEEGARVLGDVRAPRVAVSPGALIRGYVQAGDVEPPTGSDRVRAQGAVAAPRPAVRASAVVPARPAPAPVRAAPAAARAPTPVARATSNVSAARAFGGDAAPAAAREEKVVAVVAPEAEVVASRNGPPPPVVPALKKGTRGSLTKKKS